VNTTPEEQSTFLAYEKRVKEAAAELTEQQAKLADYNLLVDKLNTDTEVWNFCFFFYHFIVKGLIVIKDRWAAKLNLDVILGMLKHSYLNIRTLEKVLIKREA
jgi:hypothetical protein